MILINMLLYNHQDDHPDADTHDHPRNPGRNGWPKNKGNDANDAKQKTQERPVFDKHFTHDDLQSLQKEQETTC
jgi:hypothetical protein